MLNLLSIQPANDTRELLFWIVDQCIEEGHFFKEYLEKYLLLLTTVVGPVEDDVEHFAHINTSLPPSTAIFGFVGWNKQLQTGPLQIAQVDLQDLRSMIGQSINASSIDSNNKPLPRYCLKFSL